MSSVGSNWMGDHGGHKLVIPLMHITVLNYITPFLSFWEKGYVECTNVLFKEKLVQKTKHNTQTKGFLH